MIYGVSELMSKLYTL